MSYGSSCTRAFYLFAEGKSPEKTKHFPSMAPTNRAQMKLRHLNWAIGCNKERAVQIGELPPLPKLPPIDESNYEKMLRGEYFPIGGRNPVNNNSISATSALGTSSWARSGGMRSTYRSTIGAPMGPVALNLASSRREQMDMITDLRSFYSIPETASRLNTFSRIVSAPSLKC